MRRNVLPDGNGCYHECISRDLGRIQGVRSGMRLIGDSEVWFNLYERQAIFSSQAMRQ